MEYEPIEPKPADDGEGNPPQQATQVEEDDGFILRCCRRGCREPDGGEMMCSGNCGRCIHPACFEMNYLSGPKKLQPLPNNAVACTKKCYDKAKSLSNRRLAWNEDGTDGVNDPRNSERILLDWLLVPSNYSKFRGKENSGVKKSHFAQKIADLINAENVRVVRDAKQVLNKIKHIEDTFRRAHAFATSETGAGLKAEDEGTFQDEVRKTCPFYYDLLDIMGDRASAKPKSTSDDFSISSSDDDMDLDDGSPAKGTDNASVASSKRSSLTTSSSKRKDPPPTKTPPSTTKRLSRITLLDPETEQSLKQLTEKRLELTVWDSKQKELDYKMQKLDRLTTLRSKYPTLTDEQITAMFPELADILSIIK